MKVQVCYRLSIESLAKLKAKSLITLVKQTDILDLIINYRLARNDISSDNFIMFDNKARKMFELPIETVQGLRDICDKTNPNYCGLTMSEWVDFAIDKTLKEHVDLQDMVNLKNIKNKLLF
jgi:hypothetical protein